MLENKRAWKEFLQVTEISYDSSAGKINESHCLSSHKAQIQFSVMAEYFKRFTLRSRPEPTCQKMAQSPINGTIQPVDIEREVEVQPRAEDG